jgi:hypothetical protein
VAADERGTSGGPGRDAKKRPSPGPLSTDAWEEELAGMKEGVKPLPGVPERPIERSTPPPGGFKAPALPAETKQPGRAGKQEAGAPSRTAGPPAPGTPVGSKAAAAAQKKAGTAIPGEKEAKTAAKQVPGRPGTPPSFSKVRTLVSAVLLAVIALSAAFGYHFRTKRGVEYYMMRLRSENVAVQNQASDALRDLGEAAVPGLAQLVQEGNEREVLAAAKTLGKIDGRESMSVLRKLACHDDPEVRRVALSVLGERAAPETFANVTEQLKSSDQNTREWAIQALAGYDPKKSIPVLLELLDDNNWRVQNTAAKTLQVITGQKLGTPKSSYAPELNKQILDQWHEWWEKNRDTFVKPEPPEDKGC